jgi:hypothetical protein
MHLAFSLVEDGPSGNPASLVFSDDEKLKIDGANTLGVVLLPKESIIEGYKGGLGLKKSNLTLVFV